MDKKRYLQFRSGQSFPVRYGKLAQHLCEDVLLFSLAGGALAFVSAPFSYFLVTPLIAIFMFRCFALMHEAVHGVLVPSKAKNDILGVFSGAICLLPFEQWKKSHILHHYWSGNVEKDSVMTLVTKFPKFPVPFKDSVSVLWKLWFPVLAVLQHTVFWVLSFKTFLSSSKSFYEVASLLAPIVFWSGVLAVSDSHFLLFAVAPAILIYLIGTEVINLPHHLQLPRLQGEQKYPVWEQYKSARTCLYPQFISSFFILNFNLHAEHHMFPDAPWYYLPEIHSKILPLVADGYHCDPMFAWIVENRSEDVESMLVKVRDSSIEKIKQSA